MGHFDKRIKQHALSKSNFIIRESNRVCACVLYLVNIHHIPTILDIAPCRYRHVEIMPTIIPGHKSRPSVNEAKSSLVTVLLMFFLNH